MCAMATKDEDKYVDHRLRQMETYHKYTAKYKDDGVEMGLENPCRCKAKYSIYRKKFGQHCADSEGCVAS